MGERRQGSTAREQTECSSRFPEQASAALKNGMTISLAGRGRGNPLLTMTYCGHEFVLERGYGRACASSEIVARGGFVEVWMALWDRVDGLVVADAWGAEEERLYE